MAFELIEVCYCSENKPLRCRYCLAKYEVETLLTTPVYSEEDIYEREGQIQETFHYYGISPRARAQLIVDLDHEINGI